MADREVGQLYTVARKVLTPLLKFFWRVRIEGAANVPATGPAILCPNHISFLDSVFLALVLPRRITYVGKAEYMDDWKTKWLFPSLGMIPIDRGGGSASERALAAATRVLERGELFGIYPEGTRSRNGTLHRGHTGPARLALRVGAPIVPVGIVGTDKIQPADASLPKPFMTCTLKFGRPIDPDRYRSSEHDHLVLRQITDEVMYEIRELTGQDYVNEYATKRAEGLPTETARIPSGPNGAPRAEPATDPVQIRTDFVAGSPEGHH